MAKSGKSNGSPGSRPAGDPSDPDAFVVGKSPAEREAAEQNFVVRK